MRDDVRDQTGRGAHPKPCAAPAADIHEHKGDAGRRLMMTAIQYRDRADLMDKAAANSSHEADILQCRATAKDWRWLANLADWQDAMLKRGHPAYGFATF